MSSGDDTAKFDTGSAFTTAYLSFYSGVGEDELLIEGDVTATGTPLLQPKLSAGDGGTRPEDLSNKQKLRFMMGDDNDTVTIVRDSVLTGAVEFFLGAGDDRMLVDTLSSQGLTDSILIDGKAGSDEITIQTSGSLSGSEARDYVINVLDSGAPHSGEDILTIDGTADADVFLLRRMAFNPQYDLPNELYSTEQGPGAGFVALRHCTEDEIRANSDPDATVERINYDRSINGRLQLNTRAGADVVAVDDNAAITTIDGGEGDDTFQIGQLYGSERDFNAVAEFDVFEDATELTTRGYLSRGASLPMLIQGDVGNDIFTVYSNKSPIRLEGNDGDDDFVVRAFALSDGNSIAEGTEVLGGAGDDEVQYNINAPVNIDGGAGFDEIIVLGTELADSFVITEDGVFGAGLNVQTSGREESIEIDGLEGDDTFYVLSTRAGVGYTIIGGLGNDLFEMTGDVDENGVVSRDLEGQSAVVLHGIDITDANRDTRFDTLFVPGVDLNVANANEGQVRIDTGTSETLVVNEATGIVASYVVSLAGTGPLSAPVFVTVSAALSLLREREGEADAFNTTPGVEGASIQVAVTDPATDPNVEWVNATTLTFDTAGEAAGQTIWVRAEDDLRSEGTRDVSISHSVISTDATYDQADVKDVLVTVFDDERPDIVIENPNLLVVEGNTITGQTDSYEVGLSTAPTETTIVQLEFDETQLEVTSADSRFNAIDMTLTFAAGDVGPVLMNVAPVDDSIDESPVVEVIQHVILTAGVDFQDADRVDVDVTVYDNEAPGVLVQETDGDTVVDGTDPNDTDTYTVRLTSAVEAGKTVTINVGPDGQVLADAGDGQGFVDGEGVAKLVFDDTNWWIPQTVTLKANPAFVVDEDAQPRKIFAPQPHLVNRLRGPIEIIGGETDADRSLKDAILLPGETDSDLFDVDINFDETTGIDRLNVYNDASNSDETVTITSTNVFFEGMNEGLEFEELQSDGTTSTVRFDAGITYGDIEILEVLNGRGNDDITIESTLVPTVDSTHGGITIVHGGGGSDNIVITGGGGSQSPLVVFGDTSADGVRYSASSDEPNGNGVGFDNPAADFIDARLSTAGVVIDAGFGDDEIWGSQGNDQIAGREGNDLIYAENGDDHVYADGGFDIDPGAALAEGVDPETVAFADDTRLRTLTAVVGREARGEDTVFGGQGSDIILGDDGVIELLPETVRLINPELVQRVYTVNETDAGVRTFATTTASGIGGVDLITTGGGGDVVFGGAAGDLIDAGAGDFDDIVIGDEGFADFTDAGVLIEIKSTNEDVGGVDNIFTGAGPDVVIGGAFGDNIDAGTDAGGDLSRDFVIGDSGQILFTDVGVLTFMTSTASGVGGPDNITTGGAGDIVIGGADGDFIDTGANNDGDLVLGDEGFAIFTEEGILVELVSLNEAVGGGDIIVTGEGPDIVIGGADDDFIDAGIGDATDVVLGDSGRVTLNGTATFDAPSAEDVTGEEYTILSFNFGAVNHDATVEGVAGTSTSASTNGLPAPRADNWINLKDKSGVYGDSGHELVTDENGAIVPGITLGWRVKDDHLPIYDDDDRDDDFGYDDDDYAGQGDDWDSDDYLSDDRYDKNQTKSDTDSQIRPYGDQDKALFEGYLYANRYETIEIVVEGLDQHFEEYDVYLYLDADNSKTESKGDSVRTVRIGADGVAYLNDPKDNTFDGQYQRSTSSDPHNPELGNYVAVGGLVDGRLVIEIDVPYGANKNVPAVSGLQIVGRSLPIDRVVTTAIEVGGNDSILTGGGDDVVFGGTGNDLINAGGDTDVGIRDNNAVVGDNGRATFKLTTPREDLQSGELGELRELETFNAPEEFTFDDLILTGNGEDIVIGGQGSDKIDTGNRGPQNAVDDQLSGSEVRTVSINFASGVSEGFVEGVLGYVAADDWNNFDNDGDDDDHGRDDDDDHGNDPETLITQEHVYVTVGQDLDDWRKARSAVVDNHAQINPDTQNGRMYNGYVRTNGKSVLGVDVGNVEQSIGTGPYDVYLYIDAEDKDSARYDSYRLVTLGGDGPAVNDPRGFTFEGEFIPYDPANPEQPGNVVVFRDVVGD